MAGVQVTGRYHGTDLRAVARDLKGMTDARAGQLFKRHLERAARPYPARVRASALAIPVKEGGKHTGLRARIAQCVTLSSGVSGREAWVSVWINPFNMLPDYVTLPLYMQAAVAGPKRRYDRWRHPVYGRQEAELGARGHGRGWTWVSQVPHPYFYQPVEPLGAAAGRELDAALKEVTAALER